MHGRQQATRTQNATTRQQPEANEQAAQQERQANEQRMDNGDVRAARPLGKASVGPACASMDGILF